MNWREFEENMKTEVQQHASDLDVDAFWAKVAPKKRKRYPVLWFLLPLLFALGILGLYIEQALNDAVELERTSPKKENNPQLRKATALLQHNATDPVKNRARARQEHPTLLHTTDHGLFYSKTGKGGATSTRKITAKPGIESSNGTIPQDTEMQTANLTQSKVEHVKTNSIATIVKSSELAIAKQLMQKNNQSVEELATSSLVGRKPSLEVASPTIYPKREVGSLIKRKQTQGFSMLVQAGIGAWNANLTPTHTDNLAFDLRKKSETALESRQVMMLFQLNKGPFKNIQSGLQYSEYRSSMSMNQRWTEQKPKENAVLSINYYINGPADSIQGPSQSTTTFERAVLHHNVIRTVSIPLFFQPYTWRVTRNLNIAPSAGLLFDFFQQSQGIILKANSVMQPLESTTDLHSGFGLRFDVSLNLIYTFGKNHAVLLTPYVGSYATNLYQKNSDVASKVQNYGLRLGYKQTF